MYSNREVVQGFDRPRGYRDTKTERKMADMTEQRKRQIEKEFDVMDTDKSGTLDRQEIRDFLDKRAKKHYQKMAKKAKGDSEEVKNRIKEEEEMFFRVMDELDLDADGEVTKQEYVRAVLLKHQKLFDKEEVIKEEMEDLELKYKILNENQYRATSGYYDQMARIQNLYKVTVVEARNLEIADVLSGTSDPYVILSYAGQVSKTTVKKTNLNPFWIETFEFDKVAKDVRMEITVYDYDAAMKDDIIGKIDIDLEDYSQNGEEEHVTLYLLDENNKETDSSLKLIIQHIAHGNTNFEKEKEKLSRQLDAKEIELESVRKMVELSDKSHAIFNIEEEEKKMDKKITSALQEGSGGKISERLTRLTENFPWTWFLLGVLAVYTFFTLLACFYRPDFWDVCNCCLGFFLVSIPFHSTQRMYWFLVLSIALSIIFDILFLIVTSDWPDKHTYDGEVEHGIREFCRIISYILIFVKIIVFCIFFYVALKYFTIIDPIKKEEAMFRRYYNPKFDPRYANEFDPAYHGRGGRNNGRYGRRGRYGGFAPQEEGGYTDDIYNGRYNNAHG
ncbi:unnamed protein product [Moneuplotes crassus]|uniref:Uncharacterized protein n=1 Tax=Euplotes crassus TaxID=5936 RepID=A0AAD1U8C0_EUPCR|nr:unnamed protein product [Moneuplotes crassus]